MNDWFEFRQDRAVMEEFAVLNAQELILKLLDQSGFTRSQLAEKVNVNKSQISRLLNSGNNLTVRTMAKVLFELGYELDFKGEPLLQPCAVSEPTYRFESNCTDDFTPEPSMYGGVAC